MDKDYIRRSKRELVTMGEDELKENWFRDELKEVNQEARVPEMASTSHSFLSDWEREQQKGREGEEFPWTVEKVSTERQQRILEGRFMSKLKIRILRLSYSKRKSFRFFYEFQKAIIYLTNFQTNSHFFIKIYQNKKGHW